MIDTAAESMDESVIRFEEGVIGVPRARCFQLLERPGSTIRVLRCLDIEGFNLPVVDPRLVDPEYRPALGPRLATLLGLEEEDAEQVLLLAVTSLQPDGPVANLRAPVVVNVRRRLAAQVILDDSRYPLRAPLDAVAAATV